MRKVALVLLLIIAVGISGVAMAQPPEDDPTCGHGTQSGHPCAGDNGGEGCRGLNEADQHNPEESDPAMDLVTDILGAGIENDCSPQ